MTKAKNWARDATARCEKILVWFTLGAAVGLSGCWRAGGRVSGPAGGASTACAAPVARNSLADVAMLRLEDKQALVVYAGQGNVSVVPNAPAQCAFVEYHGRATAESLRELAIVSRRHEVQVCLVRQRREGCTDKVLEMVRKHDDSETGDARPSLFIHVPRGRSLRLETRGGTVLVEPGSGDLSIASGDGDVRVEQPDGTVSVATTQGSVNVVGARSRLRVSTVSGGIDVLLRRLAAVNVTADGGLDIFSSTGRVVVQNGDSDSTVDVGVRIRRRVVAGMPAARITSLSGAIRLSLDTVPRD
jgi:hypothetical protein